MLILADSLLILTSLAGHHLHTHGDRSLVCRPLTAAVAAAGQGTFVLDGVARMRERPIQDLVDGLSQLGVQAECSMGTGCPPVTVQADGLPSGTVRNYLSQGYHAPQIVCWVSYRHRAFITSLTFCSNLEKDGGPYFAQ